MVQNERLIDANAPLKQLSDYMEKLHCPDDYRDGLYRGMEIAESYIKNAPTVDAVEVVRVEKVKQEILQVFDVLIEAYRHISQNSNDHFGIKADAMEIARRLVNAALTDLCDNCGAKMDGGNGDG